jgi:hypothetical protein
MPRMGRAGGRELRVAYEPLPIIEVDLTGLVLDLDNYRIPSRSDDEAAALKYLFASEDVVGAAKLIIRDGYFDNEVPVVIADGKTRYIVLEGNRRVSALKALQDPTLVPSHETEIRGLLKRYAHEARNLPLRIRVMVARSRTEAAPHIARLHTGRPKKAWSRDQQANFYYSLLDGTTTVEEVKLNYPGVTVPRFMRMASMRRFVAAARFNDKTLREYAASDKLAMSSFEYAYRATAIAKAIGVTFNSDGLIEPSSKKPETLGRALKSANLESLEFLIGEFRAERLNTRSPALKSGTDEHKDLIDRLNGHMLADEEESGSSDDGGSGSNGETGDVGGSAGSSSSSAGSESESTGGGTSEGTDGGTSAGSGSRGQNHPDTKRTLDLSGLSYDSVPVNLKHRYFELRRIVIGDLQISTAMLMRSILESTIKWHYETRPPRVSGELKAAFSRVVTDYGQDKTFGPRIRQIDSGKIDQPGTIKWFNAVVHNGDMVPTADEIRKAWQLVNPVLRLLLAPSP